MNYAQVRTNFYNKYKHGPTRASNPRPDYVQWLKDFFGPEGKEFILKHAKRIARRPIDKGHFPTMYEANKIFKFETFDSDDRIKLWKPVADSDAKNGFSISTFSRSPEGYGQFKGFLDNRLPDDGITERSGFVSVIGPRRPPEKLGQKEGLWDWSAFNAVNIRFRGDGRRYYFIANTSRYDSDLQYYDYHFYPLYTRGGPYWQTIKIPFSKLIFAAKAFVQDDQPMMIPQVKFVAFNLLDTYDGPFCLEIDYIGLSLDRTPFMGKPQMYETYSYPHIRYRQISPGCDPPDTD